MSKMNKLMKSQKGSISMFVIVSVLFLTFVLVGIYASYANKLKAQEEQLGKIQDNYGEHASEDGMDNLYIAQTQPEGDNEDEETGDADTIILPSEYQQVEYIESTGTQYIDTGVVCNENLKIEVNYSISSFKVKRSYVFGVYGSSTSYRVQYSHANVIFAGFGNMCNNNITSPTEDKQYYLVMDNGKFTLDGEEIYDASSAGGKYSSTNNATIALFALNANGTIGNFGLNRIYSCKITIGETEVRNFIPCYRKSDNVVGMYDIVNDVFYTNQGTETFEKGENINSLPSEYQQVEYIESTGTQYINTGFRPNSNTSIEMKASNLSTSNACLYCARGTSGYQDNTYTAFLIRGTSLRVDYNDTEYSNLMTITRDTTYIYNQSKNFVYVDGKLIKTLDEAEFSSGYNMYLMASNQGEENITNIGNIKLYYCKIWDGETLVRNFIPCYRKSDNVIGLYDLVNGAFYTNSGTGIFTKGNDV